ncbi:MAG: ATP-binding cassette domain-containing protein, partial [Phycisphaerales bacterium JB040]
MIRCEHVTKRFGRLEAVSGVSFGLEPGGALALWGSNGAGKTTLIRCLLGVIRFGGAASIGGCDVRRRGRRARAMVGYVPQELAFHDDSRLGSAMVFFARLRRVSGERGAAALAEVG